MDEKLLIFNNENYEEYPLEYLTSMKKTKIFVEGNKVYINDKCFSPFKMYENDGINYCIINDDISEYKRESILSNEEISFNNNLRYILDKDELLFEDISGYIYHNGHRIQKNKLKIKNGDIIQLFENRIIFNKDYIEVFGEHHCNLLPYKSDKNVIANFPVYNKSPRIIKRLDQDDVVITPPPQKANQGTKGLIMTFLPTLVTTVMMVGIRMTVGAEGGIGMVVMTVGMCVATFLVNIIKYIGDKNTNKKINNKRIEVYRKYLLKIRNELYNKLKFNKDVNEYNYPSLKNISKMINNYSSRLYEKSKNDEDFLAINLGYKENESLFNIKMNFNEVELDKDSLVEDAKSLAEEFKYTNAVPYIFNLNHSYLGLVGDKKDLHKILKNMIYQLSFFHSYLDIEMAIIFDEIYYDEFEYLRWYPHFKNKVTNNVNLVYNEQTRDLILSNVYQQIKEREKLKKEEVLLLKHIILIIDDMRLVVNHPIYEYINKELSNLGVHIIYTSHDTANLLENINSVLKINDSDYATVINDNKKYVNKLIKLDTDLDIDYDNDVRILGSIIHEEIKGAKIPEKISFLDLYNVDKVENLNIIERWNNNHIYKSIAVPIGVRTDDDLVYLDLHEKAHGPHGLVAGTTGSGKSEIIQTYILSLALNFSPNEVGFLLIDYKGGGMANLFKNLPHLLGTITNLDGSESMRALVSIKSELKRRQRIFEQNNVNNINDYTKAFDKGDAKEVLPHLFIISDEFAELKKEQPEFMKELVSTARVGRSLGVHLILATQKPSGVVDDQIWSNSKFKLCLKVQNEADSKEMLKTGDAASIVQPGRAYLQVGNNEIYELFQSAYSGAKYDDKSNDVMTCDERIYLLDSYGQAKLLNDDLSLVNDENDLKSQLEVIVSCLNKIYAENNYPKVPEPWLPPLKTNVVNPNSNISKSNDIDLTFDVGVVDIPEEQEQKIYTLNLFDDGVCMYFSASGYGKTMFLINTVLNLCVKNSAKQINIYLLDFGNKALLPLNKLNQVSDYIDFDDDERYTKLKKRLDKIMSERKQLFAKNSVQNFNLYNQLQKEDDDKLPAIVLIIDQLDILKEKGIEEENYFTKLMRDGNSLGIFIVGSVARSNDLKFSIMNQIKTKIAGYTFDQSDIYQIIGRTSLKVKDIAGRVLVKTNSINECQCYKAVDCLDDLSFIEKLKEMISKINNHFNDSIAPSIKVLPEKLNLSDINNYDKNKDYDVILGLDKDSVMQFGYNFKGDVLMIAGNTGSGKTHLLKMISKQLKSPHYIFDNENMGLFELRENENVKYAYSVNDMKKLMIELNDIAEERMQKFAEASENDKSIIPDQFYNEFERIIVLIDDIDYFNSEILTTSNYVQALNEMIRVKINFVVTVNADSLSRPRSGVKNLINTNESILLSKSISNDMLGIPYNVYPEFKDGLYIERGNYKLIKMINND